MSRPARRDKEQHQGIWPLDRAKYELTYELTSGEQEALTRVVGQLSWKQRIAVPQDLENALQRLLLPLTDVRERLGDYQDYCTAPVQIILRAMDTSGTSYWSWSEDEWLQVLASAFPVFAQLYERAYCNKTRQCLLIMAYLLGPQTDYFWSLLPEISPRSLTCKLFGTPALLEAVERIYEVLRVWGYQEDRALKTNMTTTVAWLFVVNRSARLEAMTLPFLTDMYNRARTYHRKQIERLSHVLAHWGVVEAPLTSSQERSRVPVEHINTEGIAPEWVEWCLRWYRYADLAPHVKKSHLYRLFRAGRWLAATHPDVTSPLGWTSKLAAEYVAAVEQMKTGDFGSPDYRKKKMQGKPPSRWLQQQKST